MTRAVSVEARAKVNLFLEVLRRRPDGYHDISTLFQEISLADRLTAAPAARPGVALACSDPSLPVDGGNLVAKAAALFAEKFDGVPPGLRFRLKKRVPVGAGLGGGSSDAAAALRALWRLSGRKGEAPPARLKPLARRLGADVAFFLRGGRAKAVGVGHELSPLPAARGAAPYWFVLVFPRVFTSTPWVYRKLRFPLTKRRSSLRLEKMLRAARPAAEWAPLLFNRLEDVVLPRVAPVREARQALARAGCLAAMMSGSGSSVFGAVGSPAHGRRVMSALPRGKWDSWLVRSM